MTIFIYMDYVKRSGPKTTSGMLRRVYNEPISWHFKKKTFVALSYFSDFVHIDQPSAKTFTLAGRAP